MLDDCSQPGGQGLCEPSGPVEWNCEWEDRLEESTDRRTVAAAAGVNIFLVKQQRPVAQN